MPKIHAVFDASLLMRSLSDQNGAARAWTRRLEDGQVAALAPDLVWVEVGNALRRAVRAGVASETAVAAALARFLALPIRTRTLRTLAPVALARSGAHGITVYDACYVVLAEAADAVLVTADRRLAEAAPRAELIV